MTIIITTIIMMIIIMMGFSSSGSNHPEGSLSLLQGRRAGLGSMGADAQAGPGIHDGCRS